MMIKVVVPLKDLSNFWRFLDVPLINCEKELDLSWSKEHLISEISITPRVVGNTNANPPVLALAAIQTMGTTFQTNNVEIYTPVVTLSINHNIKSDLAGYNNAYILVRSDITVTAALARKISGKGVVRA